MVSVDVKQHVYLLISELRNCVKVEVAVLGPPSLISLMVSVDVKKDTLKPNVVSPYALILAMCLLHAVFDSLVCRVSPDDELSFA